MSAGRPCSPRRTSGTCVGGGFDIAAALVGREWLRRPHLRNVTDIDDRILLNAADQGVPWWALATEVSGSSWRLPCPERAGAER